MGASDHKLRDGLTITYQWIEQELGKRQGAFPRRLPMPPFSQPHARTPLTNVLGVGVSGINMAEALRLSDDLLRERGKGYICVTGVHGVMESQRDACLCGAF